MLTFMPHGPFIILFLVYGFVGLLVPGMVEARHAVMLAFGVAFLFALDAVLTAERARWIRKRMARKRFDQEQFNSRLKVFLSERGVPELYEDRDSRLN